MMRMMKAVLAVAVIVGTVACNTGETPTSPHVTRGPVSGMQAESPNGAWVRLEGIVACGMIGSDANGAPVYGGAGELVTKIENNNKLIFTCKGSGITNLSGRTQSLRGFPCAVGGLKVFSDQYLTYESQATITKDGEATMSCIATL